MSKIAFDALPSEELSAATGRKWPLPGDWERHSGRIRQLYVEEHRRLKDVIAIMAKDYGHIATPKMYKTRITKWGLDKNRKEGDMAFIFQKQTQRASVGKDASFRVHDRVVKSEEVQRYFRRKGRIPAQSFSGTPPVTPPHISYRTPSPLCSPSFLDADSLIILPNSRIAASPSLPQVFLVPEHLLFSVKSYIDGSLSNKTWVTNEQGRYISIKGTEDSVQPGDFLSYCYTAIDLFETKSLIEGRQILSKAFSLIKGVLLTEDPHTLQCLFNVLLNLKSFGHPQIAASIQTYVSEMAKRILHRDHPWGQICQLLGVIHEDCLKTLLLQCWKRMIDGFEENLGQFQYIVIDNYVEYVQTTYGHASSQAEVTLRKLVSECEALDTCDLRVIRILYRLGWNLLGQRRYLEADEVGNDIRYRALHNADEELQVYGLEISAHAQYRTHRTFQAEGNLREALSIAQRVYGKTNPLAVHLIFTLDSWLRGWGRYDDADKMKAEVEGSLETNDISV